MNRENLETRIKELGVLIEEASGNVKKLVDEQNNLTQELQDLDKPKLTEEQWSEVGDIIIRACEAKFGLYLAISQKNDNPFGQVPT